MKHNRGLTLVELLIVISVMLILMGVLLPNLSDSRKQARDRKRLADMRSIQTALQLYKNDQADGTEPYPLTASFPEPETEWSSGTVVYMKSFPKDPLYDTKPEEFFYRYEYDSATNIYKLSTCLERPESFDDTDSNGWPAESCTSGRWYHIEAE